MDAGPDSSSPDSGHPDSGSHDLGVVDSSAVDSGAIDSGTTDAGGPAGLCASTGGTVVTQLCCTTVDSFPSSCLTGACGCSPTYSHDVQACSCPGSMCFDPTMGCH